MKKFLIKSVVVATFMITLCSCNQNSGGELVYDKQYIYDNNSLSSPEKRNIVFHANGIGEYTHHEDFPSFDGNIYHYHYTVSFKYTFADNDRSAVVCFYDSFKPLENDGGSKVSTSWTMLLTVSKNVLIETSTSGYTYYVNEDYLKTLTNYKQ